MIAHYEGPPFEGVLFDIYHMEDIVYLWFLDDQKRVVFFRDRFYPEIYVDGDPVWIEKFVKRLQALGALVEPPLRKVMRHFYSNRPVSVLALKILRPSVLQKVRKKLYYFYGKLDIYHSDLEIPMNYLYTKNLHPLARVRVWSAPFNQVRKIELLDSISDLEYKLPRFRFLYLYLEKSHRIPLASGNVLAVVSDRYRLHLSGENPRQLLEALNRVLLKEDPDIVVSRYGDQAIFPALFEMAQNAGIELEFDRDLRTSRRIIKKGTSYVSYGNTIFRAASYPLFGRWHIDGANSFVMKESRLHGVIELSRLTRFPVQRLSRASTGIALTYMETKTAMEAGYLVPWQKSMVEEPKSAYDLMVNDKGGLIYMPDNSRGGVYENVVQLDFSQMYPTIMSFHNISPETVNCLCCDNTEAEIVPETGYRVCTKRRGVVSTTLEDILARRRYYKSKIREYKKKGDAGQVENYEQRQGALKWMLVTSFGYLGYRNAKFGKLESHEAVTAYGRDKLLRAKEIAEREGYTMLGAIVDCIFIQRQLAPAERGSGPVKGERVDETEILQLCREISEVTSVEMGVDTLYSWVVFFGSTTNPHLAVANRYMGKIQGGEIKYRGIALRRKDTPLWIKEFQKGLLLILQEADTVEEIREMWPRFEGHYTHFAGMLESGQVEWEKLLVRKTVTREKEEYSVHNATWSSVNDVEEELGVSVQPGEKVSYLVSDLKQKVSGLRYIPEEAVFRRVGPVSKERSYTGTCREIGRAGVPVDKRYYLKILLKSFEELCSPFFEAYRFRELGSGQSEIRGWVI